MPTIEVQGSDGLLIVDKDSGNVTFRDPSNAYTDVASIDIAEYEAWCQSIGEPMSDNVDILFVGARTTAGEYEPPVADVRAQYLEDRAARTSVNESIEQRERKSRSYNGTTYPFVWDVKVYTDLDDFDKLLAASDVPPLSKKMLRRLRQLFEAQIGERLMHTVYEEGIEDLRENAIQGRFWPGLVQGSFQFGFEGRASGWLVLRSFKWWNIERESVEDGLGSLNAAEAEALQSLLVQTDELTNNDNLDKLIRQEIGTRWFSEAIAMINDRCFEEPIKRMSGPSDISVAFRVWRAAVDEFRDSLKGMPIHETLLLTSLALLAGTLWFLFIVAALLMDYDMTASAGHVGLETEEATTEQREAEERAAFGPRRQG